MANYDNKSSSGMTRNSTNNQKNNNFNNNNNHENAQNQDFSNKKQSNLIKKRKIFKNKFKNPQTYSIFMYSLISFLFILSTILILVIPIKSNAPSLTKKSEDIVPPQTFAPFVDMASWITPGTEYSLNGVPNVSLVEEQTGIKYYNLGFIQPDKTTPLSSDGTIRWGWGGLYKLSEKGNDGYQYPKIKQTIENLKNQGAVYTISIGGQAGVSPWIVTKNVDKLEEMYLDIINTYSLKRLDLDIEESNQEEQGNIANAKAIKRVQDKTGVEIVLTIPIMPTGWKDKQIKIIKAYLNQGVKISLINSMTMCYGAEVLASEDYGDASIRAIENSVKQMQEIWASYGTVLSEKQAYQKTGATVDIGYESDLYPIFTKEMTAKVVSHAKEKGYGMISYWSLNRDAQMEANKGVNQKYEFLAEMNKLYK